MSHADLDQLGLPAGYRFREDWEVTPRQVREMLDKDIPLVLIDCRTQQEFALVTIEGSLLVPLHEAGMRLAELQKYADQKIVVYCHHGMRSLQMTAFLRHQGCKDVHSMAGGVDAWALAVEPGMKRY